MLKQVPRFRRSKCSPVMETGVSDLPRVPRKHDQIARSTGYFPRQAKGNPVFTTLNELATRETTTEEYDAVVRWNTKIPKTETLNTSRYTRKNRGSARPRLGDLGLD